MITWYFFVAGDQVQNTQKNRPHILQAYAVQPNLDIWEPDFFTVVCLDGCPMQIVILTTLLSQQMSMLYTLQFSGFSKMAHWRSMPPGIAVQSAITHR